MEVVICFLYLCEREGSRRGIDGIPKRLTDRYDFGIGLAGGGTVSLKLVGMPQRIRSGSADRQVIWVQIFQRATRLNKDCFYIVLNNRQGCPHGGDAPYEVFSFA